MPPVLGGLAEILAVGEVEEDGPRGVHEFRDAGGAPAGVQGEVGCEGASQRVLARARHRVADAGAGDEGAEAAQRLLVGEQFCEEALEVKSPGLPPELTGTYTPARADPELNRPRFWSGRAGVAVETCVAGSRSARHLCCPEPAPLSARFVDWPDGRHDRDFRRWHGRALDPIGRPARGGTLRVQERVPGKGPRDGSLEA